MTTSNPDIFSNVHKGIRRALFEACVALGRAGEEDAARASAARSTLRDALRFVAHHGENEDLLLLPLLETSAPSVYSQLRAAHARVDEALGALRDALDRAPAPELYARTSAFLELYLEHMREEEQNLEPAIRAAVSSAELAEFGRRAVERTSPADQQTMLAFMLPAMAQRDVDAFLARLPAEAAERLRALAG